VALGEPLELPGAIAEPGPAPDPRKFLGEPGRSQLGSSRRRGCTLSREALNSLMPQQTSLADAIVWGDVKIDGKQPQLEELASGRRSPCRAPPTRSSAAGNGAPARPLSCWRRRAPGWSGRLVR
jgi:hypothetical protein